MNNPHRNSDSVTFKRRVFAVLSTYTSTIWQKLIILLAVALIVLEFAIPHSYRGWVMNFASSQNIGLPVGYKFYRANAQFFDCYTDIHPQLYHDTNRLEISSYMLHELEPLKQYRIRRFKTPDNEEINAAPADPQDFKEYYENHLKDRRIISTRDLVADDLDKLSVVSGIETIEFLTFPALRQGILRGLQRYPSLSTIVFRFTPDDSLTPEFFEELAKLPNLKTLVLDIQGQYWQQGVYFENEPFRNRFRFDILAKSPSLKTLYVGSHGRNFYNELSHARESLPRVHVHPAYTAEYVDPWWLLMIPPLVLASFLIGNVLNHQYRSHISRLMPRFQQYHATIALILLISLVVYSAWRMNLRDFNGLLALVYAATIVSVGIGSQTLDYTMQSKRWQAWVFGIVLCALLISSSFLTYVAAVNAAYYWFLLFFLTAFAVSTYTALRSLRTLVYSNESGRDLLSERKSWVKNSPNLRVKNDGEYNVRTREAEIEALEPASDLLSTWARVTRWQLANRPNPIRWYMYFLLPIVLTAITNVLMRFTGDEFASSWTNVKGQLIAYGILMPFVAIMSAATNWRARRLILPSELLRPVVRENVTFEWVIGICRDVIPLSFFSALWPAVMINLNYDRDHFAMNWSAIPQTFALFALLQITAALAIVMTSIVIQNIWGVVMLVAGSTIAVLVGAGYLLKELPEVYHTNALIFLNLVMSAFFATMAWVSTSVWLSRRNFDFRT
jgi:hypothetical protein